MARRHKAIEVGHKKITVEITLTAYDYLGIVCDKRYAATANSPSIGSLVSEAVADYYADEAKSAAPIPAASAENHRQKHKKPLESRRAFTRTA